MLRERLACDTGDGLHRACHMHAPRVGIGARYSAGKTHPHMRPALPARILLEHCGAAFTEQFHRVRHRECEPLPFFVRQGTVRVEVEREPPGAAIGADRMQTERVMRLRAPEVPRLNASRERDGFALCNRRRCP